MTDTNKETWLNNVGKKLYQYGLTIDELVDMIAAQNGDCAICFNELTYGGLDGVHIDHCHSSGKVRGLLCAVFLEYAFGMVFKPITLTEDVAEYIEENCQQISKYDVEELPMLMARALELSPEHGVYRAAEVALDPRHAHIWFEFHEQAYQYAVEYLGATYSPRAFDFLNRMPAIVYQAIEFAQQCGRTDWIEPFIETATNDNINDQLCAAMGEADYLHFTLVW